MAIFDENEAEIHLDDGNGELDLDSVEVAATVELPPARPRSLEGVMADNTTPADQVSMPTFTGYSQSQSSLHAARASFVTMDEKPDGAVHFSYDDDSLQDGEGKSAEAEDRETPCSFITGPAGSGKTTLLRTRLEEDGNYAVLAATTGIAAVNLNATTIHSLLGFFDTASLKDAYLKGQAQRKLRQIIADGYKNVVVDEVSMLPKETLNLLVQVFDDVNANLPENRDPIGLILTGDFAQLPSIPDKPIGETYATGGKRKPAIPIPWAFESPTWPRFVKNMTKLTKIWRQSDQRFLDILNAARNGDGVAAVNGLLRAGVKFENNIDTRFDGTTLVGKNDEVDRYNAMALHEVQGRTIGLPSRRWGKLRSEWKNIPEQTVVKENAYVMILANRYAAPGLLEYANGDCGHVKGFDVKPGCPPVVLVELVRNGQIVAVESIIRGVESSNKPDDFSLQLTVEPRDDMGAYIPKEHYRGKAQRFVSGQIQYFPIRLAYASTVNKAQGLTLDRVQIDFRPWMMKKPAMGYTSLSRCKTMEGLRLVGAPPDVATKFVIDPKIKQWL